MNSPQHGGGHHLPAPSLVDPPRCATPCPLAGCLPEKTNIGSGVILVKDAVSPDQRLHWSAGSHFDGPRCLPNGRSVDNLHLPKRNNFARCDRSQQPRSKPVGDPEAAHRDVARFALCRKRPNREYFHCAFQFRSRHGETARQRAPPPAARPASSR